MRGSSAMLLPLLLLACDAPPKPRVQARVPDKQAIYADASLVPTREGERIRHELALAGELVEALALLELADTRVDVELGEPPRVTVVAQRHPDDTRPELERSVYELAAAIVPGGPDVYVQLIQPTHASAATPAPASPSAPPSWGLALTCLGLGLSLGVTAERLLARRRASA